MSCRAIRPWLHLESSALGEADRLVLEEHLQICERCRADRERLAMVRRIGAALPAGSIGPRGHGRAIARALMEGPRDPVPAHSGTRRWALAITVAVAVAGATALAGVLSIRSGGAGRSQAPSSPAPSEHLSPPAAPARGTGAPPRTPPPPEPTAIEGAAVPAPVEPTAPAVEPTAPAAPTAVEPTASAGLPPPAVKPAAPAGRTAPAAPAAPPVKPSAARLLAQAREAFTRLDHAAAERHADAALDAGPTRAQAAEARTLLAECAHAAGRLDDALSRYEAIAARFGDLPAGETALFAAARLEARRGRTDAARALFTRYLDRYPSGRFADDARRHARAPR
jgi:TolA-binding protein